MREILTDVLGDVPDGEVAILSRLWPLDLECANPLVGLAADELIISPQSDGRFAACVLDHELEMTEHPAALLAAVRTVLRPGGALLATVEEVSPRGLPSRAGTEGTAGTRLQFTWEALAALLFRSGFERPRIYRQSGELLVVAFRSDLEPPWQRQQRLSVVIPVFNERSTFSKTMELVLAKEIQGIDMEVIVVESNSTDGTREEALQYERDPRVRLLLEDTPQGKGHAVRRGLAAATGDFVLIQDADLEYDVDDYELLLEPLRACEIGFVLGMRTSSHGRWGLRDFGGNDRLSVVMNIGHVIFLTLFNLVYRQRLRDPFTMYKVFRRDCIEGMVFECDRFDFDWEITGKLIRAGYHPRELPVSYKSRSFAEGKKVRILRDPLSWVHACLRCRFSRLYSYS